mmetsp:Transcript_684/g.1196  ORF Transcript_684/g.1196 Transcript_684/m.1196 type:complete len:478 (+) Transcript_684:51-1484(+)
MPIQDPTAKAIKSLNQLSSSHESSAEFYLSTCNLVESKLYHQLTVQVLSFTSSLENFHELLILDNDASMIMDSNEGVNSGSGTDTAATLSIPSNFLSLYQILFSFSSKVDSLMLARIAWNVTYATLLYCRYHDRICTELSCLLSHLAQSVEQQQKQSPSTPHDAHAQLYTEAKLHLVPLLLHSTESTPSSSTSSSDTVSVESIQQFLSRYAPLLPQLASSTAHASATSSSVAMALAAYHETAMELYKSIGIDTCSESFYHAAIEYLHYTPPQELKDNRRKMLDLARDLILAALVAPQVYNLGQVVYENEYLLQVLDDGTETEQGYLKGIMVAAAQGNVKGAMDILNVHLKDLEELYKNKSGGNIVGLANIIQEKIILLGLVHMVFERESHERQMAFVDIAQRLNVGLEQVEWICMKAISKGLMKGSMDQVDGVVDVTWVMPRVLDEAMLKNLAMRLGEWKDKVGEMRNYMKDHVAAF